MSQLWVGVAHCPNRNLVAVQVAALPPESGLFAQVWVHACIGGRTGPHLCSILV